MNKSIRRPVRSAKTEDKRLRNMMAGDSFTNFAAKMGVGADNLSTGGTYSFNPITRVRTLLEWIHRGSWLGGVAVDVVADDMTRAGISLEGQIKPDKISDINEAAVALGIWNKLNETVKWSRLYGGCLAVMLIDGQDTATPLRIETVGKNQFKGLFVLDRWMVEPDLTNVVTDFGPYLGLPKWYRVSAMVPGLAGRRIHYTRLIRLTGTVLPYWQSMTENLWGLSVYERLYDRMLAFDSATQGAAQLVYKAYIRTYKIKGLREVIAAGGAGLEGLTKYVDMMRRFQSVEGVTLLDGEDEFESQTHTAFGGLGDALVQFGQQLSGALQIPLVRLFGQSPAGLNATGESDLRTYYDGIAQQQVATLKVPVTLVYRALAQSIGIKLPDGFSISFNPLWQLTQTEKGSHGQTVTQTVTAAVEAGLVSQQTALKELKQGAGASGIWSNITDEEIEAAEAELPPGPAEQAEQAQELAEQGAEGDDEPGTPGAKAKKAKDTIAKAYADYQLSYVKSGGAARHGSFAEYMRTNFPQHAAEIIRYDQAKDEVKDETYQEQVERIKKYLRIVGAPKGRELAEIKRVIENEERARRMGIDLANEFVTDKEIAEAVQDGFTDPLVEGKTATEWANEMSRLRDIKPRPIAKLFGSNGPSATQLTQWESEMREWNKAYSRASRLQKVALQQSNEAFRAYQSGQVN